MHETIFIQIAAYRDPELIPTIHDAIAQAIHPERLSFGICWQYDDEMERQSVKPLLETGRCRIVTFPASESKGLEWARMQAQALWNDESYVLQIDAHMRFAEGWDTEIIDMLSLCPSNKPLLTCYPECYLPPRHLIGDMSMSLTPAEFTSAGICLIITYGDLRHDLVPRMGFLISGCFMFADARIMREVPHDPNIAFLGDEISYSVRAWTQGWDIFHPHHILVWHNWNRGTGRISSIWDDREEWEIREHQSQQRIRQILQMESSSEDFGIYGLGPVRSLAAYEQFSGIDFKGKCWKNSTLELLRLCARSNVHPEEVERIHCLIQEGVASHDFLMLARANKVAPLTYHCLDHVCKGRPLPLLRELRGYSLANEMRMQYAIQRLPEILNMLETAGIQALPFGGPFLAASYLGNTLNHQLEFIDILVGDQDYRVSIEILMTAGYEENVVHQYQAHEWFVKGNPYQRHQVTALTHQRDSVPLRLIRGNSDTNLVLDFQVCWQHKVKVDLEGIVFETLHPQDCLIILSSFLYHSDLKRLGWLCEIAEWARTSNAEAWESMIQHATALGATSTLACAAYLTEALMGLILPDFVRRWMEDDHTWKDYATETYHRLTGFSRPDLSIGGPTI